MTFCWNSFKLLSKNLESILFVTILNFINIYIFLLVVDFAIFNLFAIKVVLVLLIISVLMSIYNPKMVYLRKVSLVLLLMNTKFQLFLFKNLHLLHVEIPMLLYLLYFIFIESDFVLVTQCSGEPDSCTETFQKSLEDLNIQEKSERWVKSKVKVVALDGKTSHVGSGTVEKDGTGYVVQTAEVKNADGTIFRRISDCVSSKK